MRMLLVILALSSAALGCGKDDSPTAPSPFPATITFQPGEQNNVGGLTILFDGVVSDSRCPSDVMCVVAGDAKISINLSLGGVGSRYQLAVTDPALRRVTFEGYEVQLVTLTPSPVSTRTIPPADYRATLTITKP